MKLDLGDKMCCDLGVMLFYKIIDTSSSSPSCADLIPKDGGRWSTKPRTCECRDLKEISGELVGWKDPQTRRVSENLPPTNKTDISFRSLNEHCSWLYLIHFSVQWVTVLNFNGKYQKYAVRYIIAPFIHKSYGILYDVTGSCDVIHTCNNSSALSNFSYQHAYNGKWVCTRQICKKVKIVSQRHDISRISDITIYTSHSIRYEINLII